MSARLHISPMAASFDPHADSLVVTVQHVNCDTTGFAHVIIANRQQGIELIQALQKAMTYFPALQVVS